MSTPRLPWPSRLAASRPRPRCSARCSTTGTASSRPASAGAAAVRTETLFVRDLTNYPLAVAVDDLGTGFGLSVDAVAPADPRQVCALLHTAAANLVTAL